ncbi:hypothetical protein Q7P35_006653 [Cladosporium inversicolor]
MFPTPVRLIVRTFFLSLDVRRHIAQNGEWHSLRSQTYRSTTPPLSPPSISFLLLFTPAEVGFLLPANAREWAYSTILRICEFVTVQSKPFQTLDFELQRDFGLDNADRWDNIARDTLTEAMTCLLAAAR